MRVWLWSSHDTWHLSPLSEVSCEHRDTMPGSHLRCYLLHSRNNNLHTSCTFSLARQGWVREWVDVESYKHNSGGCDSSCLCFLDHPLLSPHPLSNARVMTHPWCLGQPRPRLQYMWGLQAPTRRPEMSAAALSHLRWQPADVTWQKVNSSIQQQFGLCYISSLLVTQYGGKHWTHNAPLSSNAL